MNQPTPPPDDTAADNAPRSASYRLRAWLRRERRMIFIILIVLLSASLYAKLWFRPTHYHSPPPLPSAINHTGHTTPAP